MVDTLIGLIYANYSIFAKFSDAVIQYLYIFPLSRIHMQLKPDAISTVNTVRIT